MTKSFEKIWNRILLSFALLVLFLAATLFLAAFLNDKKIEKNLVKTTAEVIYASSTKSVINFYSQDGMSQNPKFGVLYPSKLKEGQKILVEYSKEDPELVRVAGRSYKLALKPILFWLALAEAGILIIFLIIKFIYRNRKKIVNA